MPKNPLSNGYRRQEKLKAKRVLSLDKWITNEWMYDCHQNISTIKWKQINYEMTIEIILLNIHRDYFLHRNFR